MAVYGGSRMNISNRQQLLQQQYQQQQQPNDEDNPWQLEKKLGKGGFGVVNLWRNQETGQYIAIKECRFTGEMTEKHKKRWRQECEIMLRLNHENIVKGLVCPRVLDRGTEDVPVMAMDYCVGGDLRMVLNKAENSCGLRESQVRAVAHDICSAVEHLHTQRISHRDLKPENIVLQPADSHRMLYKLIDLGYAKDLEQGSICTSLVGTPQYLAPELMLGSNYTLSVDFWCLGTTIFECITGFRPFFHSVPPARWLNEVGRKKHEHIYGFFDNQNRTMFSDKLPSPHQLCRHSQCLFEEFLQLMLMYSPKHRGRGSVVDKGRPLCFQKLDALLNTKLLHFFCIPTSQMLSYPVLSGQVQLAELMDIAERESGIPVHEQDILLSTGISPDPCKPAAQCWQDQEEESVLYVFHRHSNSFTVDPNRARPLPKLVHDLMAHPKAKWPSDIQKKAWSHCLYYCTQVIRDYQHLIEAQRAANVCLLRNKTSFGKVREDLISESNDLKTRIDFFNQCLQYDLSKLDSQKQQGIYSKKMHGLWRQTKDEVDQASLLELEVRQLSQHCSAFDTKVFELQRSPFAKNKPTSSLMEIEIQALKLYNTLRETPRDKRAKVCDNEAMTKVVRQCLSEQETLTKELYAHLSKIQSYKMEMGTVMHQAEKILKKIREAKIQVNGFQKQRQKDTWGLISIALKQAGQLSPSESLANSPASQSASHASSITSLSMNVAERFHEDSKQLRSQALGQKQRLQETLGSLEVSASLDWSFLQPKAGPPSNHLLPRPCSLPR